jgi:hypothetical protein
MSIGHGGSTTAVVLRLLLLPVEEVAESRDGAPHETGNTIGRKESDLSV